jgi:hypothetical protein
MSQLLQRDQDVAEKGRKNTLEDVEVPLRERSIQKLVAKLEEMNAGNRVVEVWNTVNTRRQEWLHRQRSMLLEFDEFVDPIYEATQGWSSTLHRPIALTHAKTYHARFVAALLGVDPPFTVKARQAANQDRSQLVQELMRYTLKDWANDYQGIDEVIDAWLWQWVTTGCGILKTRWERKYSTFLDVVQKEQPGPPEFVVGPDGREQVIRRPQLVEVEETVQKTCFDGPMIEWVPAEDVAIDGGEGDPQKADSVIQQKYMTASELWTLADMGVFRADMIKKVIEAGESTISAEPVNMIKVDRTDAAGTGTPDKTTDLDRYQILEAYMKLDVNSSGINSEVIIWVHKDTGTILRATYLRRVMPSGLVPYSKIDFHKRHGEDYGVGIIELLYSLTKECDAVANMRLDFGLISSMPFGFYRPTVSQNAEDRIPYEPGTLLPLDNPSSDVYFPNLGNRTAFGFQEEQALQQSIERLTSISDISLGIVGGQGATRTATGTRALLGESNANLDIFLRRMNRGWKRTLIYVFQLLQQKLPPGFQFRLLGDDGNMYWETVKDPKAIEGAFDFELESNSASSNKLIQIETANSVLQLVLNPLLIQMGVVSSAGIYNAVRDKMKVEGIRDFSRYITKPQGYTESLTPEEIANRALAGIDVKLGPQADLPGFIEYVQYIVDNDELLGQFNEEQTIKLVMKQREAQAMLEAIQQQQAQQANNQQVQINSAMAQAPSPMPQGSQPGNPIAGPSGSAA